MQRTMTSKDLSASKTDLEIRIDGTTKEEIEARKYLQDVVYGVPTQDFLLLKVLDGDLKTEMYQGQMITKLINTTFEVLSIGPLTNKSPEDVQINVGNFIQIQPGSRIMNHDWMLTKNILVRKHDVIWVFENHPFEIFKWAVKSVRQQQNSDSKAINISEFKRSSEV